MSFIKSCKEEYVVLCDADVVGNFDFAKGIKQHLKTGADITMFYANGKLPKNNNDVAVLTVNEEKRVTEMNFMAQADNVSYSLDIMVLRRDLLIKLVEKANYEGLTGLCRDILMPNLNEFKVYGFEVTSYVRVIDSMKSYVEANMALLDDDVRKDVFTPDRPLLTKNRDDMPTRYGINSKVTNSIVADGCIINGTVKNCIIFRGVNVEEGSVVEDSILMQDTKIGKNCVVKHVITDKRVMIYDDSTVKGEQEKYKFLEKESTHY
jgi:glucose-1-phosphate adenylyltransferase